jgi:hypothetical protein
MISSVGCMIKYYMSIRDILIVQLQSGGGTD